MRHGLQKGAINQAQAKGIPVNNTLVSDALKSVGYVTGAVGKWHVGCASWSMTPTYRGFDSFMDMWQGDSTNGVNPVTDETSLSSDTRSSWLYEAAAEDFIRQTYCGMMRCIDTSIEGIMAALSETGKYYNTLFVFAGDNGGAPKNGGYNYPLRGSKGTLFEGGIRQASFMWGKMLPDEVVGTTYSGAISLTDWFPTFMSIATAGMWRPNYFYELDGVDVYQSIVAGGVSPRNETLLNIIDDAGGIRMGNWVYLEGVSADGWYPQPDESGLIAMKQSNLTQLRGDCDSVTFNNKTGGWEGDSCSYLFNVVYQETNVADDYPDIVSVMSARLAVYAAEAVDYNVDSDKTDAAKEQAAETGYWGPWMSEEAEVNAKQEDVKVATD
eukprot:gene9181-32499_t